MKKRFLFLFLISGLVLMNACQKEYSLEGSNTPSVGTLQDDGTGDCLPKTVSGAYVLGIALSATTNYIEVQVSVSSVGSYTISSDTVNGMHFRATGAFTATGLATVRLTGFGTPLTTGISNFIISYGTSGCTIAVTTVGSLATFTLDGAPGGCMGAAVAGTYTALIPLDPGSNNVTINVNVTAVGAYTLASTLSNGMIFTGSGIFTTAGPQAIVLTGSGTPAVSGTANIPVSVGASSCGFTVNVGAAAGAATFTTNCATATVNGTYVQNTALGASNTISLSVTVATAGTYAISASLNGMTFSASGTFATATAQTVTLTGTGTPGTAGANVLPVTGGTAGCNITVNVTAAAGAATFTTNCATATVNGTYTQNILLTAANTISLPVTVTAIGTYTITASLNGMNFSASGSFATATAQTVTLTGTGTPTVAGPNVLTVTGGTATCTVTVNVTAAAGAATFTVNCGTAVPNGVYTAGVALTASNTISIGVTVTAPGSYTITTTPTNGITFSASGTFAATGTPTITLAGSGTPGAGTWTIQVASGATPCTFPLTIVPTSTDYFPRTANSNWSYEFDADATDSLLRKAIVPTFTALGNIYNIFMASDGGAFDSSGYYRKNGGDYFEYLDVGGFIGYDNPARAEYTMLKDNVAAATSWQSAGFTGAVSGTPLTIRFNYKILQKDVPITIVASTGSVIYQNVIVVEERYEQFTGGIWVDITSIVDFYGKSYYARGVGLIKYEALDAANAVTGTQAMRRSAVY